MVPAASIALMVFTLLVSVLLPVILAVLLYRRRPFSIRALLVGVLIFLVSQIFTRIPALQLLSQTAWYQDMARTPLLIGLFLGLTAGIFEEVGRWLGLRYLIKRQWQTRNGLAYGIGHGGIESIVLVGLAMVNNIIFSLMINNGTFDQLANQVGQTTAETMRQALINTPSYLFGIGALERAMTIFIHIALSLLVLEAVRRARPSLLLAAILLHALLDAPLALLQQLPNPILWSELWVLLCAVVSVLYIIKKWREPDDPRAVPEPPSA